MRKRSILLPQIANILSTTKIATLVLLSWIPILASCERNLHPFKTLKTEAKLAAPRSPQGYFILSPQGNLTKQEAKDLANTVTMALIQHGIAVWSDNMSKDGSIPLIIQFAVSFEQSLLPNQISFPSLKAVLGLTSSDGIKIEVTRTVSDKNWEDIHPKLRQILVKKLAEQFAESLSLAPENEPISITFTDIIGAPNGNGYILGQAIREALARYNVYDIALTKAGYTGIHDSLIPANLSLTGNIVVVPLSDDHAALRIIWKVISPSGDVIGEAEQTNTLPRSIIENTWQELTLIIADAVAPDLVKIIQSAVEPNQTEISGS